MNQGIENYYLDNFNFNNNINNLSQFNQNANANFPQKIPQQQAGSYNNAIYYDKNDSQKQDYKLMQSLQYVKERYSQLIELNDNYRGITQIIKRQLQPRFFVIKSFTEEDIHKVNLKIIIFHLIIKICK
jgi:hypothetical protein